MFLFSVHILFQTCIAVLNILSSWFVGCPLRKHVDHRVKRFLEFSGLNENYAGPTVFRKIPEYLMWSEWIYSFLSFFHEYVIDGITEIF